MKFISPSLSYHKQREVFVSHPVSVHNNIFVMGKCDSKCFVQSVKYSNNASPPLLFSQQRYQIYLLPIYGYFTARLLSCCCCR